MRRAKIVCTLGPATRTPEMIGGLIDAGMAGDRPVQVASVCGLVTPFFSAEPVRDFEGAAACDLDAYARFCRALLNRGVWPPPSIRSTMIGTGCICA